jgi:hypothetical protein
VISFKFCSPYLDLYTDKCFDKSMIVVVCFRDEIIFSFNHATLFEMVKT